MDTKKYREKSIDASIRYINQLSYLKDDKLLNEHIEKLKKEYRERIRRVQTSSVEEILEFRGIYKDKPEEEVLEEIIEVTRWAKQEIDNARVGEKRLGLSAQEILEKSKEELSRIIKKNYQEWYEYKIEEVEAEKERYDGVTSEELEEYVDLLVQREIIEDKNRLIREQFRLEYMIKNPSKHPDYIYSDNEWIVVDIDTLDEKLENNRQERKKTIITLIKIMSGVTSALASPIAIYGMLRGDIGMAVLGALSCLAGASIIIGFMISVVGIAHAIDILKNKAAVKKLKESGLYDLYLEAVGMDKQIAEYKEEKGWEL